jgi:hypothetical protein
MIEFGWYRQAVCILRQLRRRGLRPIQSHSKG